jgi:hypothetical protein
MRRLLAEAFAGTLFAQAGVLTKTALSLMALEHMDEPPDEAIEHALAVIADDAPVTVAWSAFPGTCCLLLPVNAHVSSMHHHQEETRCGHTTTLARRKSRSPRWWIRRRFESSGSNSSIRKALRRRRR